MRLLISKKGGIGQGSEQIEGGPPYISQMQTEIPYMHSEHVLHTISAPKGTDVVSVFHVAQLTHWTHYVGGEA